MSSLKLIVKHLVGSTTGGKLGSSTMWYSPWNLSTALRHSRYRLITCYLSFSWVTSCKLYRCRVWSNLNETFGGGGVVWPLRARFCGHISRQNLNGNVFPCAPVSSLRMFLSVSCCRLKLTDTNASSPGWSVSLPEQLEARLLACPTDWNRCL